MEGIVIIKYGSLAHVGVGLKLLHSFFQLVCVISGETVIIISKWHRFQYILRFFCGFHRVITLTMN